MAAIWLCDFLFDPLCWTSSFKHARPAVCAATLLVRCFLLSVAGTVFVTATLCRCSYRCSASVLLCLRLARRYACISDGCMRQWYDGHFMPVTERTREYLRVFLSPSLQDPMALLSPTSATDGQAGGHGACTHVVRLQLPTWRSPRTCVRFFFLSSPIMYHALWVLRADN